MNFQNSKKKSPSSNQKLGENQDMSDSSTISNELISKNELETEDIGANQNSNEKSPSRRIQMEEKDDDDGEKTPVCCARFFQRVENFFKDDSKDDEISEREDIEIVVKRIMAQKAKFPYDFDDF